MAADRGIIRASIFASGSGSNAENILRFAQQNSGIEIISVICDQPNAGIIARAARFNAHCLVIPAEGSKTAHEAKILEAVQGVDWIFLAGYMRILSAAFLKHFPNRIVNIHPSLLPEFPGRDSYRRAYDAGVEVAGVTLHYVDEGVDTGPIIAQKRFFRIENESFEDFRARGLDLEYQIYTEFLQELCHDQSSQGRNRVEDRRPAA